MSRIVELRYESLNDVIQILKGEPGITHDELVSAVINVAEQVIALQKSLGSLSQRTSGLTMIGPRE